jgi:hypothetical protein
VTELGRSVDELEDDLLELLAAGLGVKLLTKSEGALLDTDAAALDHEPVLVDEAIPGPATYGVNALFGEVLVGGGTLFVASLADTVHLLGHLGTVEVTELTSASHSVTEAGRVPTADASDLTETAVSLTGKTGDTPAGANTFVTNTLSDTADVDVLVLGEELVDVDLLLEEALGEIDLLGDGTTVDLDFEDVGLLDAKLDLLDLGVGNNTDNIAVVLDALELLLDGLAFFGGVLLGVLGEGLPLGLEPVLVEAAAAFIGKVLSENGGEGAETGGGHHVTDDTDDVHGGGLDDGNGFEDLLLVELGAGALGVTHDVGHTSLEAHEGGEVGFLGCIVLGEGANAATVVLGTLPGEETAGAGTGVLKLTMRHCKRLQY